METKKLNGKEKFAYGIGAVGKDMVYMLSASYISIYFLDVMGISAAAIAVLLMVARVFDAFNDPIMGVIVAKTKTKWGKFRPWLLIGTITNAVILYLMFSIPPELDGGWIDCVRIGNLHSLGHDVHHDGYPILVYGTGIYRIRERKRKLVCLCPFLCRCRFCADFHYYGYECGSTW